MFRVVFQVNSYPHFAEPFLAVLPFGQSTLLVHVPLPPVVQLPSQPVLVLVVPLVIRCRPCSRSVPKATATSTPTTFGWCLEYGWVRKGTIYR